MQPLLTPVHGYSTGTRKWSLLLILKIFVFRFSSRFAWIWSSHVWLFVVTLVGLLCHWETPEASSNSLFSDMFLDVDVDSYLKSHNIGWISRQQVFSKASQFHWRILKVSPEEGGRLKHFSWVWLGFYIYSKTVNIGLCHDNAGAEGFVDTDCKSFSLLPWSVFDTWDPKHFFVQAGLVVVYQPCFA